MGKYGRVSKNFLPLGEHANDDDGTRTIMMSIKPPYLKLDSVFF